MNRKDLETLVAGRTAELSDMNARLQAELADRRRTEEALIESEIKFRVLAEHSAVGIYLIQDGFLQYINPKFAETFEYRVDELSLPQRAINLIYSEDTAMVEEALRKRISGELDALHYEFRIRTKSANIKTVEVYSARTFYKGNPAVIGSLFDITERKKMEADLAGNEKRFRQLADATFEGIIIHDESSILDLNSSIERISGYNREELIGRNILDFIAPAHRESFLRAMHFKSSGPFEIEIVRKDSALRIIEAMVKPIVHDGKPARVVTLHDITLRKRMEESLRKSEERYKLIADNMTDMVWLISMDLKIIWLSPSAERIRGFTLHEANAGPLNRHLTPASLAAISKAIAEDLTTEKLQQKFLHIERVLELELFNPDGSTLWLEVNLTLLRDNEGLPSGILAVGRDISGRKQAQKAIRNSEERFSKVFHISPVSIVISTIEDGRYIDVNQSHLDLLEYSREEMIGHTSDELNIWAHPDDRQSYLTLLERQGGVREKYFALRTKTGEIRDVMLSAETIILNERKFILSIGYDITEQRKLEDRLRRSQKMEAIGTLAGGIAHDFNNILGGILGYTELIMIHHLESNHPAYPFMEGILRSIHRAKDLVSQIMTFSRQKERKRISLYISPIIKEVLKLLRASLPATISMNVDIAQEEYAVLADPSEIHQVLMNLVTNAAHAMKGMQGELDISLKPFTCPPALAPPHPDLKPGTGYQELTVRDSGQGIEPSIMGRIFDPFFTTKKTGEGTGLGLSVVYGIVKSYDGGIAVESEVGSGTTFRIYLPVSSAPAARKADDNVSVPGGSERIMIVDDEATLTEVIRLLLTDLGYQVTAFTNPLDALEIFKKHPADFDLVITDMTMPHMTGTDLAREIKKIRETPVILCTGMIEKIDHDSLSESGIREIIMKPLTIKKTATVVRQILDH